MLSYFKIKNFRSILDLTLDLNFSEGKLPNGYADYQNIVCIGNTKKSGERYVPVMALYGANASGKTNILFAFEILHRILIKGIIGEYAPNKLNKKYQKTTFEVGLFVDKKHYSYEICYNNSGIFFEGLYQIDSKKGKIPFLEIQKNTYNFTYIATTEYNENRLKDIFNVECINEQKQQWLPFLTCLSKNYKGLNKTILAVWNTIVSDIEVYPVNEIPPQLGLQKLAGNTSDDSIKKAFIKITSLLKKLDIDINEMTFQRERKLIQNPLVAPINIQVPVGSYVNRNTNEVTVTIDTILTHHTDIEGNDVLFNLREESMGTQILAGLLGILLSALETGKTIFVDELERSLHPLLLIEVIRMFKDKTYNQKGAQLIFTAHNTDILDDNFMRISEISIVKKTLIHGTTIKKLCDFTGIRNVTNFRKQYLEGLFSGIPFSSI